MSEIADYIFLKNKYINDIETISVALSYEKFKFLTDTDLCETGIVRNLYVGYINEGTILLGDGITYNMIHDEEFRNKFLSLFDDCEVFCKTFDDRVYVFGFLIANNGLFKRAREGGDGNFIEGIETEVEERVRRAEIKKLRASGVSESEIKDEIETLLTHALMYEYESLFIGESLDNLDCRTIKLKKYEVK